MKELEKRILQYEQNDDKIDDHLVAYIVQLESERDELKKKLKLQFKLPKQDKRRKAYREKSVKQELQTLKDAVSGLLIIVDIQAEDNGVWFRADTAPEGYLQNELRRLHAFIEDKLKTLI